MKRVLLLTSHPVAPPWDSADKQLAYSVACHVEGYRFFLYTRLGRPLEAVDARQLRVWSRDGRPGRLEGAQILAFMLAVEPIVDLVHAVISIGPGFARLAALRRRIPPALRRPVLHTVPGVRDPAFLRGAAPLGPTIALSDATAALLDAAGFADTRVVPPGIPLERWPSRERPAAEPPIVLFAGHYDHGGGAEEAIRGAAEAARSGRPLRLVLAMRPRLDQRASDEAARIRATARAAGLRDVEVLGPVADMGALIRRASIVLFPATSLAGKADVPLTVLEAMATARPVVVSDLPPFGALAGAPLRVPAGDAQALARSIRLLLDDRDRWETHARASRALVEERFSDLAMAARYRALYDELLRGR